MQQIDNTRFSERAKDFEGVLRTNISPERYIDLLLLNNIQGKEAEKEFRVNLKLRGYKLRSNLYFKKINRAKEFREQIINLIKCNS